MSFYEAIERFRDFEFNEYLENVDEENVINSIEKEQLSHTDFLNLLSPTASNHLEQMAAKAHELTKQYFGNVIVLYAPLYISNFCSNECIYCGFRKSNSIDRKQLSLEEIEKEAAEISKTELRHILLLTGEAKGISPLDYLMDSVKLAKKYFSSVSIEVYPMDEDEYRSLKHAGCDGLTVYQEVYDEDVYSRVHLSGAKADYRYRLDTPERGAKAGIQNINIGALFGLAQIEREAFFSAMHAKYLQDKFLDAQISLSLPRITEAEGGFKPTQKIDDLRFVQTMLAYRLFLPRVGINISTREAAAFRDNLIGLGLTRMSAGSKTTVGGYAKNASESAQFEIHDSRSVAEIVNLIKSKGNQPVFKDWDNI
jgi:2-iminoacetate synthase